MKLEIKKLHEDAIIPEYKTSGSAGFDFHAIAVPDDESTFNVSESSQDGKIQARAIRIEPGERFLVKTGLAVAVPEGFELQVRPRSGLAIKSGISVVNSPGTVDSDYRNEVGVILINHGSETFNIENGDRIAQGVIAKVEQVEFDEVEELDSTERKGGFGSTGI